MVAMINGLRDEPTETPFPDPPPSTTPAIDVARASLVERALAARPELRGMRAMQSEAITMALARTARALPGRHRRALVQPDARDADSGGAMIGGVLPIFGYARQGHRVAAFDARADSAAQDQAAMHAMIRFEVADAVVAVETAARQVDLVRGVALPRARESFQASLAGLGAGTTDRSSVAVFLVVRGSAGGVPAVARANARGASRPSREGRSRGRRAHVRTYRKATRPSRSNRRARRRSAGPRRASRSATSSGASGRRGWSSPTPRARRSGRSRCPATRAGIVVAKQERVSPLLMTVLSNLFGLLPVLADTGVGVGADVAKRIAAPMWGGLVSLTLLTLLVIPAVYVVWRSVHLRRERRHAHAGEPAVT